MSNAYPRYPAIHGDEIVFVAEDDLWQVSADGGAARRLTAGRAATSHPRFSPDGSRIAYTGAEEGPAEVHVMAAAGGEGRRLTYEGASVCRVVGWEPDGESVIYAGNAFSAHRVDFRLRRVSQDGGPSAELPYGRAASISRGAHGVQVIGREYWRDFADWKRYRGGTAGRLWIDAAGDGEFRRLTDLDGNLSCPQVIGERVYFLSDHEGHGNVYSTDFAGADLRRHTDHEGSYARGLSGDGARLVYHCAGELYVLEPEQSQPRRLDVEVGLGGVHKARRFVDASQYLDAVAVSPEGSRLAVTARGKPFVLGPWEGPAVQQGEPDGVRYRDAVWMHDGMRLVAVAGDSEPAERLVVFSPDGSSPPRSIDTLDLGRVAEMTASPTAAQAAISNHRGELVLVSFEDDQVVSTVLDTCKNGRPAGLAYSPDGKWLVYAFPTANDTDNEDEDVARSMLKLVELDSKRVSVAAQRVLHDFAPAFDPAGKYLYFVGKREFRPVYDSLHFDMGFPLGSRPYAVALRADVEVPFTARPRRMHDSGDEAKPTPAAGAQQPDLDDAQFGIDLDGIQRRIVPLPVPDGRYDRVLGADGKVLTLSRPLQGETPTDAGTSTGKGVIDAVDLKTGKVERIADQVSDAWITADGKTLSYTSGDKLRVVAATKKPPETADCDRESGWVDLSRLKLSVRPDAEWPQMFRETWRLINEQFWTADMSGVDWDAVYERYAALLPQISTRDELADLTWEMLGELGTSHAYADIDGDRDRPSCSQGFLGARFEAAADGCRVVEIYTGDVWDPAATSPLNRPGVDVREGDVVTAVDGLPTDSPAALMRSLVNRAGEEIELRVRRGDGPLRGVVVRALDDEFPIRYREWVEANRRAVHEATDGRVGYVHVPNMMGPGYAEFHRGFLNEYDREGLIVDVRYNGGGHVSQLVLEKLARRRVGYSFPRWGAPIPSPSESPRGPMVALTNELSGSDGDIFSHTFKLLRLGPLVGTRTWGGVIGMFPANPDLVDKSFVSQPELAFWFDDVAWGVENYGTDPDLEVDWAPQDYAAGKDPQLDAAVATALQEIQERPPHTPKPTERPRLAPGRLPARPQDRR